MVTAAMEAIGISVMRKLASMAESFTKPPPDADADADGYNGGCAMEGKGLVSGLVGLEVEVKVEDEVEIGEDDASASI
jgi:hypothetical protein